MGIGGSGYAIPEFTPVTKRPAMNMAGCTASDCSPTPTHTSRLFSNSVFFLRERERERERERFNHIIQEANLPR